MDAEIRLAVGDRIAELRVARRMSQRALARALKISQGTVSKWEDGKMMVKAWQLPIIAAALGVTAPDLIPNEEEAELDGEGRAAINSLRESWDRLEPHEKAYIESIVKARQRA